MIKIAVGVVAVIFAAAGAVFWFASARVKLPASISAFAYITHPESPQEWDGPISGTVFSDDLKATVDALHEQSRLNRWAAICTGVAVAMQAIAVAMSLSQ